MNISGRCSQYTLAVMIVVSCTACATVGRSFNYKNVPTLEIGALSSADYRDIFGIPWTVQTTTNSDGKFEDILFLYGHGNIATAATRALFLEFRDGKLNAWIYISAFEDDRTAVDLTATDKIRNTISTKTDVQVVLGKPHGKARCPSLLEDYKNRCKHAEVWAWGAVNPLDPLWLNPTEAAMIFVLFDSAGTVTQLETVQSKSGRPR